jgi:hypothetical protein
MYPYTHSIPTYPHTHIKPIKYPQYTHVYPYLYHKWYQKTGDVKTALIDDEVEKMEDKFDAFCTKTAVVQSTIYDSIPPTIQVQLKSTTTACEMWNKLICLAETRSSMVQVDKLNKL